MNPETDSTPQEDTTHIESSHDAPSQEAVSAPVPAPIATPTAELSAEAKAARKAERMAALMAKQKQAASNIASSASAPLAVTQPPAVPKEDPVAALKAYLGVYAQDEKVVDPYCELPPVLPEMPEDISTRIRTAYHRCMSPASKDDEVTGLCSDLVRMATGETPAVVRPTLASNTTTVATPMAAELPTENRRRKKKADVDGGPARSSSAGTSVRERLEARRSGSAAATRAPSAKPLKPEDKPVVRAAVSAGSRRRRVGSTAGISLMTAPVEQRAGMLLNSGVGFKGATLLHACAFGNKPKTAAALVKLGADPNVGDRQQRSALMVAAALGHAAAVKSLLANRADPQQTDVSGWTPILYATRGGHARIATELVRHLGHVPVQMENK